MSRAHLVVGGGFYGLYAAERVAAMLPNAEVAVAEREDGFCSKATYNNQARVHNGYHYPRSVLTGLRSRINYPRFKKEFAPSVFDAFRKIYAVERRRSNVTAAQFEIFCERIGAEIKRADAETEALFEPALIEGVYAADECAFNATALRDCMLGRLRERGVRLLTNREAVRISAAAGGGLEVLLRSVRGGGEETLRADYVYNCTYSNLNALLRASGLSPVELKHEAAEIALVEVPEAFRGLGITLMCGPFFSIMPFPDQGRHSLSHVSYTPHFQWRDGAAGPPGPAPSYPLRSNYESMIRDAARYVPGLAGSKYVCSIWETKTVLPRSDVDDSRPILFHRDPGLPGVLSILGGKIDNVFDMDDALDEVFAADGRGAGRGS